MKLSPTERKSRLPRALPMTSMIDVVFLLLIFFLVTSSFAPDEGRLSAAVQREGSGGAPSDLQPQIVEIGVVGGAVRFTIGGLTVDSPRALGRVLEDLPTEAGMAVRAAPDVPVAAIASVMQTAHDAGFEKRSYVTSRR
ncbi:MAG: biopolymer transporter ExbD [Planctomycetota bacterium]